MTASRSSALFDFDDLEDLLDAQSSAEWRKPLPPALQDVLGLEPGGDSFEVIHVPQGLKVRVVCISDIHVDQVSNKTWLESHLPKPGDGRYNVLLLPGDVSDDLGKIQEALEMLITGFDLVCFTPGNHDIWVCRRGSPPDSMTKLRQVLAVCDGLDVRTGPVRLVSGGPDLLLLPLLSWYSFSFDKEPDPVYAQGLDDWMDFRAVIWPDEILQECRDMGCDASFNTKGVGDGFSKVFAIANEPRLAALEQLREQELGKDSILLTFSHFLPRQELFPEKRFIFNSDLHKVCGSDALEEQVRRVKPHAHVVGHTHIITDLELDGVRYVQWPLGSPKEQRGQTRQVAEQGMLVIYDDGEPEGLSPIQPTHWSVAHRELGRNPTNLCPAPWVRNLYRKLHPDVDLGYTDAQIDAAHKPRSLENNYEKKWRC